MKKVLSAIVVLAMLFTLATTTVFAADAKIVAELDGSVGATGNWDGDVARTADGSSLVIGPSGDDGYGYVFEDLEAGVYKIGFYMTIDSFGAGKQMRVSPRVTKDGAEEHRCWIDFKVDEVTLEFGEEAGKVLIVAVITVPEEWNTINVGAWQDADAYVGTLDKVVLATGEYSFDEDGEYTLAAEIANTNTFGEDAGNLLQVAEDDWVSSFDTDPTPATPTDDNNDDKKDESTDDKKDESTDDKKDESTDDKKEDSTETPKTADVSVVLAMVAAGAAALGGLKLRKK